ncbi:uncharacterized protein LOC129777964 [Toxorhynchites rutilus septentrionalis]|uniref:uncharacterized protein LOC129777964 n=1 Tax=Toxorhynchites rutilus septentrionalis TaxID=329112 RepID=UPI0024785C8D|nr:uncharacterized protein LOC129777964 [Toxorhynchites rutilus septentrionalis]
MKNIIVTVILLSVLSQTHGIDWYTFTDKIYGGIQIGLSQLNSAAADLNRTINEQQDVVVNSIEDVTRYINTSLAGLWARYPSFNLTTDKLYGTSYYTSYVRGVSEEYRQSVTANVMVPAQEIVRNILSTMVNFYSSTFNACSEQKAMSLSQTSASVGRLKDCLSMADPFARGLASTTRSLTEYAKAGVDIVIKQLKVCSPNSRNCINKFFTDLPNQLNNIIATIPNLSNLPYAFINPGVSMNQECVKLISSDVQDIIQNIADQMSACR